MLKNSQEMTYILLMLQWIQILLWNTAGFALKPGPDKLTISLGVLNLVKMAMLARFFKQ